MQLFTFTYNTQWMDGFYQVLAENEESARNLMHNSPAWITTDNMVLQSVFYVPAESAERLVYAYEVENPNYQG